MKGKRTQYIRFVTILSIIFILLLSSGCGSFISKEKSVIETKNGKLSISDDKIELKTDDGNSNLVINSGTDLPKDYPKNILPVIKGGKVTSVIRNEKDGELSFMIMVEWTEEMKKAFQYYEGILKDSDDYSSRNSEDGFVVLGKKENLVLQVTAMKDNDKKSTIYLNVGPKK